MKNFARNDARNSLSLCVCVGAPVTHTPFHMNEQKSIVLSNTIRKLDRRYITHTDIHAAMPHAGIQF